MVNGLDSTERAFPERQDDRGGKSRLWYAHLFKMSLLNRVIEQKE